MSFPDVNSATGLVDLTVRCRMDGVRIDQYLASVFKEVSRSYIKKIIDDQGVMMAGLPVKASHKVRHGDSIQIRPPEPTHELPVPEDIPLEILYEDEFLAVVNKPFDMVVHPAKGNWSGTLVNALQFHFAHLSEANGTYRPGIVHRLDRDTSGVIIIAKEESAHRNLSMQFETRRIFKEYVAITQGVLDRDSDYIESRIAKHPSERVKMIATEEDDEGKDACSYYEVIERFRGFCYCRVHPKTGRTHQIRVHLASVGCPVLADKVYGGRDCFKLSDLVPGLDPEADSMLISRQALHARRLRFSHPQRKTIVEVEAPLPAEFENTLTALRRYRPVR